MLQIFEKYKIFSEISDDTWKFLNEKSVCFARNPLLNDIDCFENNNYRFFILLNIIFCSYKQDPYELKLSNPVINSQNKYSVKKGYLIKIKSNIYNGYGEVAPLVFGHYYTDQATGVKTEEIYEKNLEKGAYEKIGLSQKGEYKNNRFFARMYENREQKYIRGYQQWQDHDPNNITFSDNLEFFIKYQIGWSYMRYFMWNFAGRQNDFMNMDGNALHGNWESGVSFIDNARLGQPSNVKLPDYLKNKIGFLR